MPTSHHTIQSYNQNAERWAGLQKSNRRLAHNYIEKPAMFQLLPESLGGQKGSQKVLCVGSGSGEECFTLQQKGAEVTGLDASQELVKIAKRQFYGIEFIVGDQEALPFEAESFDIVFSSLTIHYSDDWSKVLAESYRVLKPGGTLIFSTHHPIKWGAEIIRNNNNEEVKIGYTKEPIKREGESGKCTISGDYLTPRMIETKLLGTIEISFFHQPISEIIKTIQASSFAKFEFSEPLPIIAAKQEAPDIWNIHSRIPLFMVFRLQK
jgi:ubiquinone/menaquinone biosynthesis C-methylase UbiE